MTLTDRLSGTSAAGADAAFDVFLDWAGERGFSLYAAQEEAVLALAGGAHVVLATPTGLGQVARRGRRPRPGPRRGPAQLVHRADQGPGQREVLRARGDLRRRAGRHAHRRRGGQPGRPDHLRDGRGARQPRAARPRARRHRPRRHGRVPLLHRARPRLGVAGAAAAHARHPVPPHVGDPRRDGGLRGGPHPPHRPRDRGDHRRGTAGAAGVLVGAHRRARDDRAAAARRPGRRSTSCRSPRRPRSSRPRR